MPTWVNIAPIPEEWYFLERRTGVVIDTSTRCGKQFGRDACDSDWWQMVFDSESVDFGSAGFREVLSTRILGD